MSRYVIAFDPQGPAASRGVHTDRSGEPLVYLDEGEVSTVKLDLTGYLQGAETVSSAAATADGVTATVSTSSPIVTLVLSAATGWTDEGVKITVTTSTGDKWVGTIRVRRRNRFSLEENVRDYV